MRTRFFIVALIILAALSALLYGTSSSLSRNTILVVDGYQVATDPDSYRERELRVRGFVKPGSILRYSDRADFILQQNGQEVQIRFDGSSQLPDTFQDNAPVRADGRINAENVLISHRIEAKCTSKYEIPAERGIPSHERRIPSYSPAAGEGSPAQGRLDYMLPDWQEENSTARQSPAVRQSPARAQPL